MAGYVTIRDSNTKFKRNGKAQVEHVRLDEEAVVKQLTNFLAGSADGSLQLCTENHRMDHMMGLKTDVLRIERRKGKTRIMFRMS